MVSRCHIYALSVKMGKAHKLPFLNSETIYSKPLKLIATDLWGATPVHSDYGFKYCISFIDAFSRYVRIYFLKSNDETYSAVVQYIAQAENQTNCQVKVIQSDGGQSICH